MEISNNAMAIIILCSHLSLTEEIKPLETLEWSELACLLVENEMQPSDLIQLTRNQLSIRLSLDDGFLNRIERLVSRSASLTFELEKLYRTGIRIITRADDEYPKKLKKTIGKYCPPIFYYAGNLELSKKPLIGMVGSRTVNDNDIEFTKQIVNKVVNHNMGVVSGGAKGVDFTATSEAIKLGGYAVEYLSNSLQQKLKNLEVVQAIRDGQLLVLSETKPQSGFNVGFAMKRNKYIYGNSYATIVVRSDYNKGGTWNGAFENINKHWSQILCWNNPSYKGNLELINKGATPIDDNWNFTFHGIKTENIQEIKTEIVNETKDEKEILSIQLSLFD
jgi:predicted Rossmann fold nucleotide-binding protein DprA/Smf involved in DNA uptake